MMGSFPPIPKINKPEGELGGRPSNCTLFFFFFWTVYRGPCPCADSQPNPNQDCQTARLPGPRVIAGTTNRQTNIPSIFSWPELVLISIHHPPPAYTPLPPNQHTSLSFLLSFDIVCLLFTLSRDHRQDA